ncbi:hypothetical protein CRENPOLYSF1_470052 [Crenothrix polyspora]|uniref:Uncharacterized protein n=1 Tax=Crenothrix polyspora TaxID=360316 RepID=A0A1R4HCL2_9GAMM|nr:hypothetical protein CRENPOLYSF1_470052 [Crenothrix polyspora]
MSLIRVIKTFFCLNNLQALLLTEIFYANNSYSHADCIESINGMYGDTRYAYESIC